MMYLKGFIYLFVLLLFSLLPYFNYSALSADLGVEKSSVQNSFAVVELFTSQGCSSCPPADRILRELKKSGEKEGTKIFPISFHVDYWNYLGWRDPHSSDFAVRRQREYSSRIPGGGMYTPEMVVNGRMAFNGSNRTQALRAVAEAISQPASLEFRARLDSEKRGSTLSLHYQLSSIPSEAEIIVLFLETPKENQVSRGENRGKTLSHVNVVRHFERRPLSAKKSGLLSLRHPTLEGSDQHILLLLQSRRSLQVLAATRIELEN